MERLHNTVSKKPKAISKGAPSGFLLSVAIHAAAFMLAGMLVVFSVTTKEEKKFVPPKPIDRPKMKLKKPTVKVVKNAKPKSSTRIVTQITRASMPDLQMPEMSGMGNGLGAGDLIGFDIAPDIADTSFMGSVQSIGSDLQGTFYDFNRRRNGNNYTIDQETFISELARFVKSGFRHSTISSFYSSPKALYATTIAVPPIPSPLAPSAFGEPDNRDFCWMVHYQGKLTHASGIKFRFVGNADDVLVVAVDGKVVLNGSRGWDRDNGRWYDVANWHTDSADNRKWIKLSDYASVSSVIELNPGEEKKIDVMIAEVPGGNFNAILCVMEEGVTYENNTYGEPILPLFKTAELSREYMDLIYRGMPANEISLTNGPVFNDYQSKPRASDMATTKPATPTAEVLSVPPEEPSRMRLWNQDEDSSSFEGEFVTVISGSAVLRNSKGKTVKIPLDKFNEQDKAYISLAMSPELDLDLGKKIRQKDLEYSDGAVRINEYMFSAKIKQTSSAIYNHPLEAAFYVIGSEIGANKYMLLDKTSARFTLNNENDRSFSFSGRTVEMLDYVSYEQRRGDRYEGFLITITDERGEIIAHRSSPTWLYENLENLQQLPLNSFMDKTCTRVWPTPLKSNR
jgi:hypothetical protein